MQEAAADQTDGVPDGPDYYVEDGRVVFTEAYHLRRGYCCGSGCRHCPFADRIVRCVSSAAADRRAPTERRSA